MTEPKTDPRAAGPVPPEVIGQALREVRGKAHAAAVVLEALERHHNPEIRASAVALRELCYALVNVGNASSPLPPAPPVPRWLRVWRAIRGL